MILLGPSRIGFGPGPGPDCYQSQNRYRLLQSSNFVGLATSSTNSINKYIYLSNLSSSTIKVQPFFPSIVQQLVEKNCLKRKKKNNTWRIRTTPTNLSTPVVAVQSAILTMTMVMSFFLMTSHRRLPLPQRCFQQSSHALPPAHAELGARFAKLLVLVPR